MPTPKKENTVADQPAADAGDWTAMVRNRSASHVMVGSYIDPVGERLVGLEVNGERVSLSIPAARLLAKQLVEWADFAVEHQEPIPMMFKYVWKAAAKDAEAEPEVKPETPAPKPTKSRKRSTRARA